MSDQPKPALPLKPVVLERLDSIEDTLARIESKLSQPPVQVTRPRLKPAPKIKPNSKYRRVLAYLRSGKTPEQYVKETGELHIGAILSRMKKKGDWVPAQAKPPKAGR